MLSQLMRLQVHLGSKHNELLLQASRLPTNPMILREMREQGIIVEEVLRSPSIALTTDVTLLMTIPAMDIQLIIAVESCPAERTQRMAFEPALIHRARVVIPFLHVL